MLKTFGIDPLTLGQKGPALEVAYSCSLCGLCAAVCPVSLDLRKLFSAAREDAVETKTVDINEYRYLFPDRPINILSVYRELTGVHYDDLPVNQAGSAAFFPGCTMLTYNPELIKEIFGHLQSQYKDLSLITDCCGATLEQLGLKSRGESYVSTLREKLIDLGVKSLILACPHCYNELLPVLKESGIQPVTIYDALEDNAVISQPSGGKKVRGHTSSISSNYERLGGMSPLKVTVHDSCPDRSQGIFAGQVRKALTQKGFELVEMEHNRELTICCGSGGQVSHCNPELAGELLHIRLREAQDSGAQILAGYCQTCVLNFAKESSPVKILHSLNLLLDFDQDFVGVRAKAKKLFAGPEGERLWEKIMLEENPREEQNR